MSDEPALLQSIIAHADDDTPRLVYADWLDEHEAPIQAEFVRVQCRLASASAADSGYPDLVEQHAELIAQFRPMAKATVPELPEAFAFYPNLDDGAPDAHHGFRRGFLYAVRGAWFDRQMPPTDAEVEQFCAGLPQLIATTTARELNLFDVWAHHLALVLTAPGAESLTGLVVAPDGYQQANGDEALRVLAQAKATAGLERLYLHARATTAGLRALLAVKFDRLRHIDLPLLTGSVRDLDAVTGTKWFQAIRSVRAASADAPLESALVAALAKLPHLESLDLRCRTAAARQALGAARGFPALTRLTMWGGPTEAHATRMAKAKFPRLAELGISNVSTAAAMRLLSAKWFPQLRVLALADGTLTDKFAVALADSAAAHSLRILRLGNAKFSAEALAALTDGTRFPNVTTLDLASSDTRKPNAGSMAKFAAGISLPRLRHLDLTGWALGDAGAKALAANPALANLTRLALDRCVIGEKGFTALVRSPHLQHLVELDVGNNNLKKAAALLDAALLPRLAAVQLGSNPLTNAAREKLHRARGWLA